MSDQHDRDIRARRRVLGERFCMIASSEMLRSPMRVAIAAIAPGRSTTAEPDVIAALVALHRGALGLDERIDGAAEHGIDDAARDVGDVGGDGGGRRIAPGAGANQSQRADGVAVDRDGVEHAHRLRERLGLGDHGRMHALLDAVFGALGDAEQFYAEPEFVGGGEIGERDRLDAFDRDRARVDAGAEGERGEDRELMRGVEAADVEGRIGLGVAELLRFGEADVERQSFGLHAREDVVAGAVENAADAPHRIAGEPLAQGLDDGNAAADRRLEGQRGAAAFREPCEFERRGRRASPCSR